MGKDNINISTTSALQYPPDLLVIIVMAEAFSIRPIIDLCYVGVR